MTSIEKALPSITSEEEAKRNYQSQATVPLATYEHLRKQAEALAQSAINQERKRQELGAGVEARAADYIGRDWTKVGCKDFQEFISRVRDDDDI
ncbi:hypothetical protein HDU89_005136 [Geranomyces variabilis]|nr:hypothetical protein HDU89_005136 [Geranomyces variabilis]